MCLRRKPHAGPLEWVVRYVSEGLYCRAADPMPEALPITVDGRTWDFRRTRLALSAGRESNVFARKNNKSVRETLAHRRYGHLSGAATAYVSRLDEPLGAFLYSLKIDGDTWYRNFLNPYGDLEYCSFVVGDSELSRARGIYLYMVGDEFVYLGRSRDPFRKRVNQGYGRIHPKNCYLDGQATNCHFNSLVAMEEPSSVSLWLCPMGSDEEIVSAEQFLIAALKPPWNIHLR